VTIRLSMVKDLDHRFEARKIREIRIRKEEGNCSPKIVKHELTTCEEGIKTTRSRRAWTVDLERVDFVKSKVIRKEGDSLENHEM
jgi:hypothetical protein